MSNERSPRPSRSMTMGTSGMSALLCATVWLRFFLSVSCNPMVARDITIDGDPDEVWEALNDPELLAEWLGDDGQAARRGGRAGRAARALALRGRRAGLARRAAARGGPRRHARDGDRGPGRAVRPRGRVSPRIPTSSARWRRPDAPDGAASDWSRPAEARRRPSSPGAARDHAPGSRRRRGRARWHGRVARRIVAGARRARSGRRVSRDRGASATRWTTALAAGGDARRGRRRSAPVSCAGGGRSCTSRRGDRTRRSAPDSRRSASRTPPRRRESGASSTWIGVRSKVRPRAPVGRAARRLGPAVTVGRL